MNAPLARTQGNRSLCTHPLPIRRIHWWGAPAAHPSPTGETPAPLTLCSFIDMSNRSPKPSLTRVYTFSEARPTDRFSSSSPNARRSLLDVAAVDSDVTTEEIVDIVRETPQCANVPGQERISAERCASARQRLTAEIVMAETSADRAGSSAQAFMVRSTRHA
jgi:hypothetical protein